MGNVERIMSEISSGELGISTSKPDRASTEQGSRTETSIFPTRSPQAGLIENPYYRDDSFSDQISTFYQTKVVKIDDLTHVLKFDDSGKLMERTTWERFTPEQAKAAGLDLAKLPHRLPSSVHAEETRERYVNVAGRKAVILVDAKTNQPLANKTLPEMKGGSPDYFPIEIEKGLNEGEFEQAVEEWLEQQEGEESLYEHYHMAKERIGSWVTNYDKVSGVPKISPEVRSRVINNIWVRLAIARNNWALENKRWDDSAEVWADPGFDDRRIDHLWNMTFGISKVDVEGNPIPDSERYLYREAALFTEASDEVGPGAWYREEFKYDRYGNKVYGESSLHAQYEGLMSKSPYKDKYKLAVELKEKKDESDGWAAYCTSVMDPYTGRLLMEVLLDEEDAAIKAETGKESVVINSEGEYEFPDGVNKQFRYFANQRLRSRIWKAYAQQELRDLEKAKFDIRNHLGFEWVPLKKMEGNYAWHQAIDPSGSVIFEVNQDATGKKQYAKEPEGNGRELFFLTNWLQRNGEIPRVDKLGNPKLDSSGRRLVWPGTGLAITLRYSAAAAVGLSDVYHTWGFRKPTEYYMYNLKKDPRSNSKFDFIRYLPRGLNNYRYGQIVKMHGDGSVAWQAYLNRPLPMPDWFPEVKMEVILSKMVPVLATYCSVLEKVAPGLGQFFASRVIASNLLHSANRDLVDRREQFFEDKGAEAGVRYLIIHAPWITQSNKPETKGFLEERSWQRITEELAKCSRVDLYNLYYKVGRSKALSASAREAVKIMELILGETAEGKR